MSRWVTIGIVVFLIAVPILGYNSLVNKDEAVTAAIAEVQNYEKRRGDLIPNLVKTVQGYATHEKDVFESVTKARADVGKFNIDASKLASDPALLKQFQDAQATMAASLSRLIAVAEAYPQLKANEGFLSLQKQLEGSENRIAVARRSQIIAVQVYNAAIRRFPGKVYAQLFTFLPKSQFEATQEERRVPTVDFKKT